ncbi:MAG: cache domain-containing protein [Candidatus Thorarchaeota archaeon]|jgi:HAMP domain-containing protein
MKLSKMAKTKKKGSFRRNVILTFVAISIISLGATGGISYFFVDLIGNFTTTESTTALESQIQTNMDLTAEKTALVINQKLTNAESMIAALAEEAERLLSDESTYIPRRTYYDYFFEYGAPGEYPDDTVYDPNYDLNVSWTYSSWYAPPSALADYQNYENEKLRRISNLDFMFNAVHQQLDFRWLYVAFESDSMFINYPGSLLGGTDLERTADPWYATGDEWYTEIRDRSGVGGEMVFVEPYYDPIDGVLLISIGRAIHFDNGTLIGVVAGDITIEDINQRILDVTVLESGYAALVEGTFGGVVAHPDVVDDDYLAGLPALTAVESNQDGGSALTSQEIDQVISGATGYLQYSKDGDEYLLAYTSVDKGGYICIIVVPLDEVLAAIPALEGRIDTATLQATMFILTITIAGIMIAAGVAVVISNQITGPLQYMMDLATKNVAAMIKQEPLDTLDLQVDTTYTSKDDEIGELARAFQGMLDSIKDDESQ